MNRRCPKMLVLLFVFHIGLLFGKDNHLEKAERVELCELLKTPSRYNAKLIATRASYCYGFGRQELFCLNCPGYVLAIEFSPDQEVPELLPQGKDLPGDGGIVTATFWGYFKTGISEAPFMNVTCIRDIVVVTTKVPVPAPEDLPPSLKKKLCH